jgi:hypothetical protein
MTPEQRKLNAERLLNDETLRLALDMIQHDAIGVFTYPNASQEDIMEAHRMVRALDALRTKLEAFVVDGKMAERRSK